MLKKVIIINILLLLTNCTLSDNTDSIKLTISPAATITTTTANINVTITNGGNSSITAKGICWSTSPNPTISLNTKTNDGTGTSSFNSLLSVLIPGTTYYLRAYATNNSGTVYSIEITFTTTAVNLKTGLVAYYPFSGNADDTSGNGNNGVINGATLSSDRYGNINSCFSFINNGIVIPNSFYNNGWQDYTINLWFLTYDKNQAAQTIIVTTQNGEAISLNHPNASNKISHWKNSNINVRTWDILSANPLLFNNINNQIWYNLILVKRGNIYNYFINGQLDKTSIITTSAQNQNSGVRFGNNSPNGEYMNGKIDDIGIWNRALSQDEITALYNGQKP